ncbi:hypothetical protein CMEL01_16147 [Colletotrichum melonis]|uniref:Uncharacterized protein n=1 Tax=Colletotrichum melonis TaxID=1209925 RepID=A0AAI9UGC0_9PEZI|nr:hypothetical protein CMEL01_16147 [Colletotrichum melonis]
MDANDWLIRSSHDVQQDAPKAWIPTIAQSRKEWDLSVYSTYLAVWVLLCNVDSPVAGSEAAFKNSPGPGDRWKKEAIFEYYGYKTWCV